MANKEIKDLIAETLHVKADIMVVQRIADDDTRKITQEDLTAGYIPVYTTAGRPAAATAGRKIYDSDLDLLLTDDGSAWNVVSSILIVLTNSTRGAAGNAGRLIFNSDDGKLNVDNGTVWTLPDGTTT